MTETLFNLGHKIRKIRELKNLSQENMAEALGIKQSSYRKWETGEVKINEDKLNKVAMIIGVEPDVIRNYSEGIILNNCTQSQGHLYQQNNYYQEVKEFKNLFETIVNELKQSHEERTLLVELLKKDKEQQTKERELLISLLEKLTK